MLQTEALEILKTGVNVFLTGVPGAGKTYVINKYIEYLEDKGIYPAVTASTGIAATHIGGSTIHSFSGIGIDSDIDDYKIDRILEREKLVKRIQNTKVLIIDEISMLDAKTLDSVNKVLKAIKDGEKAFGGIQVIFVGDFFQLPPVTKKGEAQKFFAFYSSSWKEARPLTLYLEEQYRQSDEVFNKLLLAIRDNSVDEMHIEILEDLRKKTFKKLGLNFPDKVESEFYEEESVLLDGNENEGAEGEAFCAPKEIFHDILELHSHNKNVDSINETKLKHIKEKEVVYQMTASGGKRYLESLVKSCLSPEVLKIKKGAKVIFTKNDIEGKYVNGTLGEVVEADDFSIKIVTKSDKTIDLKKAEWAYEEDGKVKARIEQYPLRLAWAITVHKSQGMSLDEAIIDLSQTFEYGQGYVALSRVRSLDGLFLRGYNPKSLRVNEAILEFDEKIKKDSKFIKEKFLNSDKEKLAKLQNDFITKSGGKKEGGVPKKEVVTRIQTEEVTLGLIKSNMSLAEISKERDMTVGTILSHLETLFGQEKISKLDLQTITGINVFDIPGEVKKAFKKHKTKLDGEGNIKLSPVFKELGERFDFDTLRIFRIFI